MLKPKEINIIRPVCFFTGEVKKIDINLDIPGQQVTIENDFCDKRFNFK